MVKEPQDILEELKLAGPRDEYDRLILSSESIHALDYPGSPLPGEGPAAAAPGQGV